MSVESRVEISTYQLIVGGKYILSKPLGTGSFGEIYFGINKELPVGHPDQIVAIKLEKKEAPIQLLKIESKIYNYLYKENVGVPKIYWSGEQDDFNVLIMEVMGPNLEYLLNACKRTFSLKTTLILAQEMIRVIQYLHSRGIIHRDIKPDNFLIGLHNNHVHVIDFGLCKSYKDADGKHIPFSTNKKLIGTIRYAPINSHKGWEQSRRDDLESIGYLLVYFLKPLPWQGLGNKEKLPKEEKYQLILECKERITPSQLCAGLPKEFRQYFEHVKSLAFDQKPNYTYLYTLFNNLFTASGFEYDGVYDWSQ
jgi:serine/threonine protein kinase